MNFVEIHDLPVFDLYEEYLRLVKEEKIPVCNGQICINTIEASPQDCFFGTGSLILDWNKSYMEEGKLIIPPREIPLKETDFTILCEQFIGSLFEEVYNCLTERYIIGRIRLMRSVPKTCLTWHIDDTPRIHYVMKTQPGCFMVIENESKYLEKNKWYYTNTILPHTAFNGSTDDRMHLVVVVLGNK